jgi:V8-like Glu-specific endopeptidase
MGRRQREFGATSRRERHRADLFYADLIGMPRARGSSGESYDEAADTSARIVEHPRHGRGWLLPTASVMTAPARPTVVAPRRAEAIEHYDEEILGADNRELCADTTQIAFRFVCCLDLLFAHPTDPQLTFLLRGSGTLISDRHVLTAAHNILNTLPGFPGAGRRTATRIFAAPGRNGRALPFGESVVRTMRVTPEWTTAPNAEFDFGLLTLTDPIGAQSFAALGGAQLGFWSHPRLGGGTHIRPLEVSFLGGRPVNLDGYPNDKCLDQPPRRALTPAEAAACTGTVPGNPRLRDLGSTQWRSFGNVVNASPPTEPRCITYDLDSEHGHSGGPIWLRWEQYRNIVAVNTGGFPGPPPAFAIIANMGVRITADVLQRLRTWIRADGVTPTF